MQTFCWIIQGLLWRSHSLIRHSEARSRSDLLPYVGCFHRPWADSLGTLDSCKLGNSDLTSSWLRSDMVDEKQFAPNEMSSYRSPIQLLEESRWWWSLQWKGYVLNGPQADMNISLSLLSFQIRQEPQQHILALSAVSTQEVIPQIIDRNSVVNEHQSYWLPSAKYSRGLQRVLVKLFLDR